MVANVLVRIPVDDTDGHFVGWVVYEELGNFVEIGGVYVPAEFHLRCPGAAQQPSLLITFQVLDGAAVCTAINIGSKTERRQVLPRYLETIRRKLNGWTEVVTKLVMHTGHESGHERAIAFGRVDPTVARSAYNTAQRRTRTKITDKLLKEVAQLYRDTVDEGAWQAIAGRFGVSKSTAGRYVLLARRAGYLPPTEPGKKTV